VREAAPHHKIISGNFQVKLGLNESRFRELNSRSPIGEIDDGSCQPPSVIQNNDRRFKNRSSSELAPFRSLFYRQGNISSILFRRPMRH
jgi:hypothetical protein